ncbi:MAG: hypothetical protein WBW46_05520 [Candidatus Sulfotelmatobacter sp.]
MIYVKCPLHSLIQAGGSLATAFGLSGAVRPLGKVLPPLDRVLVPDHSDSISCLLGLAGLVGLKHPSPSVRRRVDKYIGPFDFPLGFARGFGKTGQALRVVLSAAVGLRAQDDKAVVAQAGSRFLHSAVAGAPAPVGMTK